MSDLAAAKTDYGNWVSTRLILVSGVLSILFSGLSLMLPVLGIIALFFCICLLYFAYARYLFSPRGKNIQARIQELVVECITDWDGTGKVLDIGCGNGPLTILMAKLNPQAEAIGIDYWGKSWDYSKRVCERNAEIEGVAERVTFERASAASLPFDDEAFDLVISNLVFHNVQGVRDKTKLIKEALRVTKKGGWFIFQDLFLWRLVYGKIDDLLVTIRSWGLETVEFADTSKSDFIPKALRLPFMLGMVGMLYGKK